MVCHLGFDYCVNANSNTQMKIRLCFLCPQAARRLRFASPLPHRLLRRHLPQGGGFWRVSSNGRFYVGFFSVVFASLLGEVRPQARWGYSSAAVSARHPYRLCKISKVLSHTACTMASLMAK